MMQSGNTFKTARDQIIEDYTPMVRSLVEKVMDDFSIPYDHLDLMLNEGCSALMDAIENYRPEVSGQFDRFCVQKIQSRLRSLASNIGT